jgi:hypothetical protein
MPKKIITKPDREIVAISEVYDALKGLEPEAQARVLSYVATKLKIEAALEINPPERLMTLDDPRDARPTEARAAEMPDPQDDLEGISPVAKKWMTRNGLQAAPLSKIFSLSTDEIDLIAKTVPGKNKKEKMRSVFLLKGIAAYLGSGATRFTHEQVKEASLHYDAFDAANFSHYFKSLASEVSGTKDSEYVLTPRGLASATDMVKEIIQPAKTS